MHGSFAWPLANNENQVHKNELQYLYHFYVKGLHAKLWVVYLISFYINIYFVGLGEPYPDVMFSGFR